MTPLPRSSAFARTVLPLIRPGPSLPRERAPACGSGALARPVVLVGLLLDVCRAQREVDVLLDPRADVVLEVHAARQADELLVEGLGLFLEADVVLDHPEPLVARLQLGPQARDLRAGGGVRHPGVGP